MIGKKFGRLTIISQVCSDKHGKRHYLCKCSCGNNKVIAKASILRGYTMSCGCIRSELVSSNNTTHGKTNHPSYIVWQGMMSRCNNTKFKQYKDYGGRGIKIEWKSFQEFYDDIGKDYKKGLSIERIDVNKSYSKGNCTLIPLSDQNKNRRGSILVNYNGSNMCLSEACRLKGIPYERIRQRITKLGWPVDLAFNTINTLDELYGSSSENHSQSSTT